MAETDDLLLYDDDCEHEEVVESELDRNKRMRSELSALLNGSELFSYCTEKLPITGQKFGISLSMNRALSFLKGLGLDEKTPTWANCKKGQKDIIKTKFDEFVEGHDKFKALRSSILEGFTDKKNCGKKIAYQALIIDEVDETSLVSQEGKSVDRTALLAYALADPHFTPVFTELVAPIDAAFRPAFLDHGAAHLTVARWSAVAQSINLRRAMYSNTYADLDVKDHGCVLGSIDPALGKFTTTASLPMGKQLQQLLTKMRNQLMLLNQRVFKSGDNSSDEELIASAFVRTGKYILMFAYRAILPLSLQYSTFNRIGKQTQGRGTFPILDGTSEPKSRFPQG